MRGDEGRVVHYNERNIGINARRGRRVRTVATRIKEKEGEKD
jgi:hypothetical protein